MITDELSDWFKGWTTQIITKTVKAIACCYLLPKREIARVTIWRPCKLTITWPAWPGEFPHVFAAFLRKEILFMYLKTSTTVVSNRLHMQRNAEITWKCCRSRWMCIGIRLRAVKCRRGSILVPYIDIHVRFWHCEMCYCHIYCHLCLINNIVSLLIWITS